jgi:uncharacterized membrane protein YhaH (DUF805 family)
MTFATAVRRGLSQYSLISGRASRSEYWFFFLFVLLVSLAAGVVDALLQSNAPSILVWLALVIPSLAVGIRRLHDTNRSAWTLLLVLLPVIGGIILLIYYCLPGTPGRNEFGPAPAP